MLLTIYSVGKNKEAWLETACEEFIKRLSPYTKVTTLWAKDDEQLLKLIANERLLVCLDPKGKLLTSEEFSEFVIEGFEKGGARLGFVIGGPLGLPRELKAREDCRLISFSKMTFTHQMCRLILLEQVYRAFEIERGSPYHK